MARLLPLRIVPHIPDQMTGELGTHTHGVIGMSPGLAFSSVLCRGILKRVLDERQNSTWSQLSHKLLALQTGCQLCISRYVRRASPSDFIPTNRRLRLP